MSRRPRRAADPDVMRLYRNAVGRYETAARLLDDSSALLRRRGGTEFRNPLVQVVRGCAMMVHLLARELREPRRA